MVPSGNASSATRLLTQWLRGKRANSKQSTYLAAEQPQERLLLTVEDSLRYYRQAYSPQVEGVKLPSEGCGEASMGMEANGLHVQVGR